MIDPASLTPSERRQSLTAIMASIAVAGMGIGLYSPLMTYALEGQGRARTVIGMVTATFALAILLFAPHVPKILRRYGMIKPMWVAMATASICLILFRTFEYLPLWFAIEFALGLSFTTIFVTTETWISMIADDEHRGRIMATYATFLSVGVASGLTTLYWMGSSGWGPIIVTCGLLAVAGMILIPARARAPKPEASEEKNSILPFLKGSPSALLAALIFGAVEMGILNLLNVFGIRSGLEEGTATLMLLSVTAGNIIFQYPIGVLADKFDRRIVLAGCAGTGAIASFLIPAAIHNPLYLYGILLVVGGIILGMYAVGLTLIGERFQGSSLAGANAAFVTMYGLGALFGPLLGGFGMDVWDPNGLMVVMGALCGGYALMVFARLRRNASLTEGAG